MSSSKPKIAITVGDPAGIGPEVSLKAAIHPELRELCKPLLVGNPEFLRTSFQALDLAGDFAQLDVHEAGDLCGEELLIAKDSALGGRESLAYLQAACDLAEAGHVDAIVTAPISKQSLKLAGSDFPGHTEFFAERTNTKRFLMMFYAKEMKLALLTRHIPLCDVPQALSESLILDVLKLLKDNAACFGCPDPKFAVLGLNPHAGESGVLGSEEQQIIAPAIAQACALGIDAHGPFPSDTFFYEAHRAPYDFILAMYHDQGLIPFKMLAFDRGVNVTLGLPFVRTSVDHGTALDIAGKGVAKETSMLEAIKLAVQMSRSRR